MTSHTHLSPDQRFERLDRRVAEIELWEKCETTALDGYGAALAIGFPWPSRDGAARFDHPPLEAPADWPLDATRLHTDPGGERPIAVDSSGRTKKHRLDTYHSGFPVPRPLRVVP